MFAMYGIGAATTTSEETNGTTFDVVTTNKSVVANNELQKTRAKQSK